MWQDIATLRCYVHIGEFREHSYHRCVTTNKIWLGCGRHRNQAPGVLRSLGCVGHVLSTASPETAFCCIDLSQRHSEVLMREQMHGMRGAHFSVQLMHGHRFVKNLPTGKCSNGSNVERRIQSLEKPHKFQQHKFPHHSHLLTALSLEGRAILNFNQNELNLQAHNLLSFAHALANSTESKVGICDIVGKSVGKSKLCRHSFFSCYLA